jgi:GxxExxY protein
MASLEHRGRRGNTEDIFPELSRQIINCAMAVHSELGPGLLESAYESCLCSEFSRRRIPFERQVPVPLEYRGLRLDCGYRLDIVVAELAVVEVKSCEALSPLHRAQLLTYLRLSGKRLGLLVNFNVPHLRDGIDRIVC